MVTASVTSAIRDPTRRVTSSRCSTASYSPSDIAAWTATPSGSPWQVTSAQTVEESAADAVTHLLAYGSPFKKPYAAVSATVGTLGENGVVGVCAGVQSGQYYCCDLLRNGAGPGAVLYATTNATSTSVTWGGSFMPGDTVVITQDLATRNHCDVTVGGRRTNRRRATRYVEPGRVEPLQPPQPLISTTRSSSRSGRERVPYVGMALGPGTIYDRVIKRAFDVTLASVALVTLSPLLAGVASAVRRVHGSPVLFRQRRGASWAAIRHPEVPHDERRA